ncbi:MAG TPA: diacylglycerol kinase family protein [Pyrinomonadaceae bacterium]|jgi:YegS/Rv2252/BmrU family lipid kinase
MSTLPLVIVNPASARGATESVWPMMASDLRTHFGPFTCVFTKESGDGRKLAAEGATEGRRLIIACGGDGTISEVANGILESGRDVELGVLPSGTGGDFRRSLSLPTKTAAAARALRTGHARRMDVGRVTYVNYAGSDESRYFLGVASFGMSPAIIERVKREGDGWLQSISLQRIGGQLSFALATLRTTLETTATAVRVQLDEQSERHLTVRNLCVANARYFGGGMKIAPGAMLDDSRFDIISVGDMDAFEIIRNAPKLYLGKHLDMLQVQHGHARKLSARPARIDEKVAIEVDGELPGRLPATFEILPAALSIRCPAQQKI